MPRAKSYHVAAVVDAFKMLEVLTWVARPMGPTELAESVHVPRNKAFRIMRTLAHIGMVEERDGLYRLTPRAVPVIGQAALDALVEEALSLVQDARGRVAS